MIDEAGISYLDTRNNVAHCGHCHPRIVQAVQEQVATVNTNTRYLHPVTCELAKRLVQTLPAPLDTVFFCNSGSEANDLALRLARVWAGGSNNTIVVDGAYHGHTIATVEVSPYKYESKEFSLHKSPVIASSGVQFHSRHIWKVSSPDVWRGPFRNRKTAAAQYASQVEDACRHYKELNEKVRAFIIEGGMSVAGVILPPSGYLRACVDAVHKAGGLYIADEVQTGFGRLGSCFWAFQYQHDDELSSEKAAVVPDIVTMGKSFGNGIPLAAVVTRRKIAAAFEDCQVEYFNTFGGNPVSAAAGLAVLDVIQDEKLQRNALKVGCYLKAKFKKLQETVEWIGDIRGSGLFLGVELVESRATCLPATMVTSWLCSQLKQKYHILTSIDGPHNNVLVIKPPMIFSRADSDYFVRSVEEALTTDLLAAINLCELGKTPT